MAIGLLPAILSHARRALTKILRLDTDYTTARAGKIDNLDVTVSSRLADSDAAARTQTGLTSQGYTSGRAPNLDNVDTTVSSRLADSNAVARVQTGLDNNGYNSSRAAKLDDIDVVVSSRAAPIGLATRVSNTTTSGIFQNLVESLGSGRLRGISVSTAAGTGCTVRIFIDGVNQGDITFGGSTSGHIEFNDGGSTTMFKAVSTDFGTMLELDVFFKNSMQIQHKSNDGSSNTVIANFEEE